MPPNVPKGSVLAPGGAIVAPDPGDPICAAYEAALEDWCKSPEGSRGDFNDKVFEKLNDPDLAATRERPIGFIGGARQAGGPRGVLGLQNLSNAGGYGSRVAQRSLDTVGGMTRGAGQTFSGFRNDMSKAVRGELGGRFRVYRVLCPDAQRASGRPVEIKRPTEPQSHPGQLNNYAKASPTGTCELVNCAACELACKDWNSDCEGY